MTTTKKKVCHYCEAEAMPAILRTLEWYGAELCETCEDLLEAGRVPREPADIEERERVADVVAAYELEVAVEEAQEWSRKEDERKGIFRR